MYILYHRFKLLTGTKLSRRFLKTDKIQVIKDFLNLHFADSAIARGEDVNSSNCTMIKNFAISTHFPKVELIDMTQTVEAAVSLFDSCSMGFLIDDENNSTTPYLSI
jgi:hypothetical protein